MKVRISYTVDVDDRFRRALNVYFGRAGLATREQVRVWFERNGESASDDLMWDLQEAEKREAA